MKIGLFGPLFLLLPLAVTVTAMLSCAENKVNMDKVSGMLLQQVELRRQQIAEPDDERLKLMKELKMYVQDLKTQRIFIYVKEYLTAEQQEDLASIGINIHMDSWIPPIGNHPYGFLIADMPVEQLEILAARDYIVRLDTAEREIVPQCQIEYK
ncbi:MAG: hypothetical protein PHU70_05090 [Dehalococcoidia bacterium]|nr:hypothetical protein [Dehalococcoidia bacterium]MDD5494664.1 hypothetical protein [Dehalococcoidia bacterium]